MDQQHEDHPMSIYNNDQDFHHKNKFSGSLSDSGQILANIRNKHFNNIKQVKKKKKENKIMKEYMTYNAVNFDPKANRKAFSSHSRENRSITSSRSMPKGNSSSLTNSGKKFGSKSVIKNKSFNNKRNEIEEKSS